MENLIWLTNDWYQTNFLVDTFYKDVDQQVTESNVDIVTVFSNTYLWFNKDDMDNVYKIL
jgi:hypothetical protein